MQVVDEDSLATMYPLADAVPCNYCGVVFDDVHNLQKHIFNDCFCRKKRENQLPLSQPPSKKQKLLSVFEEDTHKDPVFMELFEDAKELNEDQWREIYDQLIADGLSEKDAAREAHEDMAKTYKVDFFAGYEKLLESLYALRQNGIHNLVVDEIDELIGDGRNTGRIIRWISLSSMIRFPMTTLMMTTTMTMMMKKILKVKKTMTMTTQLIDNGEYSAETTGTENGARVTKVHRDAVINMCVQHL